MELGRHFPLIIRTTISIGALGALVTGCGDSTTSTDPEGLPFAQFTETYRATQCTRAANCRFMPAAASCYQSLSQDYYTAQAVAAVAFGDITYDPLAAQTCIETLGAANCAADYNNLLTDEIIATCDAVFGNRRGEGEDCVASAQCAGTNAI